MLYYLLMQAGTTTATQPKPNMLAQLFPVIPILLILFYFLIIRPQRKKGIKVKMSTKLTISIIFVIIGIIAIIISQTVSFTNKTTVRHDAGILGTYYTPSWETNDELKNVILYGGIGFLLIGGISLAIVVGKILKEKND